MWAVPATISLVVQWWPVQWIVDFHIMMARTDGSLTTFQPAISLSFHMVSMPN